MIELLCAVIFAIILVWLAGYLALHVKDKESIVGFSFLLGLLEALALTWGVLVVMSFFASLDAPFKILTIDHNNVGILLGAFLFSMAVSWPMIYMSMDAAVTVRAKKKRKK